MLSRLVSDTPTESVAVFGIAAAALSLLAHLGLEESVWPNGAIGWGANVINRYLNTCKVRHSQLDIVAGSGADYIRRSPRRGC